MYSYDYGLVPTYENRLPANPEIKYQSDAAIVAPYYRMQKGERRKYLNIITGLKRDLDININDYDKEADNIKLFFKEKLKEKLKRWETSDISIILKHIPENQTIDWAGFSDWPRTTGDFKAFYKNKKALNLRLLGTHLYYFRARLIFFYHVYDNFYGGFSPRFKKIESKPAWSPRYDREMLKNWQSESFYSHNFQNNYIVPKMQVFETHIKPRLFLRKFNPKDIYKKYLKEKDLAQVESQFYNLFKLPIYKSWTYNNFFVRRKFPSKKRMVSRLPRLKNYLRKSPNYLPYARPDNLYFNLQKKRFSNPHSLSRGFFLVERFWKRSFQKNILLLNNSSSSFLSAVKFNYRFILNSLQHGLKMMHKIKLVELSNYFFNAGTIQLGKRFMPPLKHTLIHRSFLRLTQSTKYNMIVPYNAKNRINVPLLPKPFKKFKRFSALFNFGQRLEKTFSKMKLHVVKFLFVAIILRFHLISLSLSNIAKFKSFVNFFISGLFQRLKFSEIIFAKFNKLLNLAKIISGRRYSYFKKFLIQKSPGQFFETLNNKNPLLLEKTDNSFTINPILTAFWQLFPTSGYSILTKIGQISIHALNLQDFNALPLQSSKPSDTFAMKNFIKATGLRYHYAVELRYTMQISAFLRTGIFLKNTNFCFMENIDLKLLYKLPWLRDIYGVGYRVGLQQFYLQNDLFNTFRQRKLMLRKLNKSGKKNKKLFFLPEILIKKTTKRVTSKSKKLI